MQGTLSGFLWPTCLFRTWRSDGSTQWSYVRSCYWLWFYFSTNWSPTHNLPKPQSSPPLNSSSTFSTPGAKHNSSSTSCHSHCSRQSYTHTSCGHQSSCRIMGSNNGPGTYPCCLIFLHCLGLLSWASSTSNSQKEMSPSNKAFWPNTSSFYLPS